MDCGIIKDLLPIYIEKLTSEPSNKLIEEHIKDCDDCKQMLSKLQEDIIIDNKREKFDEINKLPNTLIKRIQKNIYEKILMAISITLFIGIIIGIFSAKIFMFMAFLGSISILAFIMAICVSMAICNRKPSLRGQFKSLGNWTFLLSIAFCGLFFILFRFYFNESNKVISILSLEILYNIILSLTLRIYVRLKLPKDNINLTKNQTSKKIFIVTFITLTFIVTIITVPVTLLERNRIVDNLNLDFVNDSGVVGKWTTVDFVKSPEEFNPDKQSSKVGIFLKEMTFLEDGLIKEKFENEEGRANEDTPLPWLSWTKGYVMHNGGDHTLSKYDIREIKGSTYMFFEWKNGDYIYFHKQPSYYVLKKEAKK